MTKQNFFVDLLTSKFAETFNQNIFVFTLLQFHITCTMQASGSPQFKIWVFSCIAFQCRFLQK